jgi:hypothetical protein
MLDTGGAPRVPTLADPAPVQPQPRPAPTVTAPAAPATTTTPAAEPNKLPAFPSQPYQLPSNISDRGKTLYGKLKPILDGPPQMVHQTLTETEWCTTEGDKRKVDTRVIYALAELMQETVRAEPHTAAEVFKRMIAIKSFVQHSDDLMFSSAPSIKA